MLVENQSEIGHLEDLGIDGDTVKMDFYGNRVRKFNLINLTQDRVYGYCNIFGSVNGAVMF
jgi:hypothetical protein